MLRQKYSNRLWHVILHLLTIIQPPIRLILEYLFYFYYFTIDQFQIQNTLFASLIDCKMDKYSRF